MSSSAKVDITPDITQLRTFTERIVLCPDFWGTYTTIHVWNSEKLENSYMNSKKVLKVILSTI